MRENKLVYSVALGLLVPSASITIINNNPLTGFYFTSTSPMIQAGSLNSAGRRLMSFDSVYRFDINKLRVRSFGYE